MPEILKEFSIFAPAKVNLHLKVLDKRQDGFHNIESLFLKLDFGDFLHFELNDDENLDIVMEIENNIITKAVNLFKKKTGFNKGLKITVDKRIPIGGGLGGGSSDAASALLALNKIAGFPLTFNSLLEAAASLGSDVPFLMHETTAARVTGRGEIIEPVDVPKMFLVLINPGFSSDTAAAFKLLDKYREFGVKNERSKINTGSLNNSSFFIPHSSFLNDFFYVFPEKEKLSYLNIISDLREQGAVYANLSGSGSTCFGVFENEERAFKAVKELGKKWQFVIKCSSFIVSK